MIYRHRVLVVYNSRTYKQWLYALTSPTYSCPQVDDAINISNDCQVHSVSGTAVLGSVRRLLYQQPARDLT